MTPVSVRISEALSARGLRFTPDAEIEASAFSTPFKVFAVAIVAGCGIWVMLLQSQGKIILDNSAGSWLFVGGALGMLAYTLWHIIRSRTRFTATHIHQAWMWDKELAYREMAFAKLIRINGLEWLIAPRLYTRSLSGKLAVFYVATPELWRESARLVLELEAHRQAP